MSDEYTTARLAATVWEQIESLRRSGTPEDGIQFLMKDKLDAYVKYGIATASQVKGIIDAVAVWESMKRSEPYVRKDVVA